ncbi:hypothetical protein SNOG_15545 [Parastagonospora nodorum SN15]|uniref:Uncharacterized protein n=1 Tax=Phaeosphaeria nodorum (strain SN15 / ATCC MYA-4574 / FGSC 10173) TaxID=321614 RepID=Q0TXR9_PHANO|nr:hypothetical protein SNOG_15545 [Parastagonospora nodorum SN15]EAT76920.1 hypothetical protein SNOG_15545 [Parastagonospora nodorum SN15]
MSFAQGQSLRLHLGANVDAACAWHACGKRQASPLQSDACAIYVMFPRQRLNGKGCVQVKNRGHGPPR